MKAFLLALQKLQSEDDFNHGFRVDYLVDDEGFITIEGSFYSNIDKNNEGDTVTYHCHIADYKTKRENEAEFEKFKFLLMSDAR